MERVVVIFILLLISGDIFPCARQLREIAESRSWTARADTTADRLKLLSSLLTRHPGIVTANLQFKRNLLETYAHIAPLVKALGGEAAPLTTEPAQSRTVRYVASGEAKFSDQAIRGFLDGRIKDIEVLELLDDGDLAAQVRHFKERYPDKEFTRNVRRLLQVVPFLFDSEGRPLFRNWNEGRKKFLESLRTLGPNQLEAAYGDLLKEHLLAEVDRIAAEKGFGAVKAIYQSVKNQLLDRELKGALTPVAEGGREAEVRTISLEQLPAWVAVTRGCYGGDCSILSVPYYPLVKGSRAYFIRKGEDPQSPPSGYAFSVPVRVNGKEIPYVITVNGATLTQVDVQMIVSQIAKDYGSDKVILPDFKANEKNQWLVNTDAARKGMTAKKKKHLEVELPKGWAIVDAYMRDHQAEGYTNYYETDLIGRAYLGSVGRDPRVIEEKVVEGKGGYEEVTDLARAPLIQRAILAVQAIQDSRVKKAEVLRALDVTRDQVKAARSLLEISEARGLHASEYRRLKEAFAFGVDDVLAFRPDIRAETLRTLYEEDPKLFVEHGLRNTPKGINALGQAYGIGFEDLIRAICASNLSDRMVLSTLKDVLLKSGKIKPALELAARLPREFSHRISQAFIQANPAQTRLGKRLEEALKSNDPTVTSLISEAIASGSASPIIEAFRGILKSGRDAWLADSNAPIIAKARYLGLYLNTSDYKELFSKIPAFQKTEVRQAIETFSNSHLFGKAATNAVLESFEFVDAPIPEGGVTFTAGSPPIEEGRWEDEPLRDVTLTEPFQMQATPVTQRMWRFVMGGENRSIFKGEDFPVVRISWNDAQEFIKKLNKLDPRFKYRLPTEAEWEFMTRAGTRGAYFFGGSARELSDYAHFDENSDSQTHAVAEKRPNPWGLYDTVGNVWEWQSDRYEANPNGGTDPNGPSDGFYRVMRGGSWRDDAQTLRSARRSNLTPGRREDIIGLRLVRTPK